MYGLPSVRLRYLGKYAEAIPIFNKCKELKNGEDEESENKIKECGNKINSINGEEQYEEEGEEVVREKEGEKEHKVEGVNENEGEHNAEGEHENEGDQEDVGGQEEYEEEEKEIE